MVCVTFQDTLAAMEALFEFTLVDPNRNVFSMDLKLESSASPEWNDAFMMAKDNYTVMQEVWVGISPLSFPLPQQANQRLRCDSSLSKKMCVKDADIKLLEAEILWLICWFFFSATQSVWPSPSGSEGNRQNTNSGKLIELYQY